MNFRSIQSRLILWHTALIILTSMSFGAFTYYDLHHRLYEEMLTTLERRIEHVRDNILKQSDPAAIAQQIREVYSPEQSSRFIRISRADGSLIYVSGTPRDHAFDPATISPPSPAKNTAHIERTGSGVRLFIVQREQNDTTVEMGIPTDQIDSALQKLVITLLLGLPLVAIIAIASGYILVRRALKPVEVIRATAEKITYSNLQQRLPVVATGDALEHLSLTLNQMLERLERSYQQASRFSADASHELRTPLAIMRSELEATVNDPQTSLALNERIGSVLEETERLSGIVEGLFAIARLDAGEAKIEHFSFDLSELAQLTIEQMHLLADEKKISITVDAPLPVYVTGDAPRLKQIIVNLLDNAIKYTLSGGAITVSVHAKSAKAILTFKDNGIGISSDALPHVFERFYRADKVRSRASQGAGLGLSIVRSICQAHGGSITIQSSEESGTTIIVELPLSEKEEHVEI